MINQYQLNKDYENNKLTATELNQLVLDYQQHKNNPTEELIWANIAKMIYHKARILALQTNNVDVTIEDLFNHAYIAFKRALLTYDNSIQFNSYAMYLITNDMTTYYNQYFKNGSVTLPSDYAKHFKLHSEGKQTNGGATKAAINSKSISLNSPLPGTNEVGVKITVGDTLYSGESSELSGYTLTGEYSNFEDIYFKLIKPLVTQYQTVRGRKTDWHRKLDIYEIYTGLGYNYEGLNGEEISQLTGTSKQYINQIKHQCEKVIKEIILDNQDIKELIKELEYFSI